MGIPLFKGPLIQLCILLIVFFMYHWIGSLLDPCGNNPVDYHEMQSIGILINRDRKLLFIDQMIDDQFGYVCSIFPRSLDAFCNITHRDRGFTLYVQGFIYNFFTLADKG